MGHRSESALKRHGGFVIYRKQFCRFHISLQGKSKVKFIHFMRWILRVRVHYRYLQSQHIL